MGKVSFNGVRVGVKRHELWFERNMYNVHTGSCKKNKKISNEKNYQCILSLWSQPHHQLQQWWLVEILYNICLALTKKTNENFFSQKMWWKRKCVKIRFVWKRWCIKAFDFLKTCCGIYILYDWIPARLKRMCDLLFSFDRFPGFHRCVLSDNYSFCLNSRIILHLHSRFTNVERFKGKRYRRWNCRQPWNIEITFSIKMNSGEFLENTPQIVPDVETILCMYNILDVERCGQFWETERGPLEPCLPGLLTHQKHSILCSETSEPCILLFGMKPNITYSHWIKKK